MASGLINGSFHKVSSITTGGRCSRSRNSSKNYQASSLKARAAWNNTTKMQNEYNIGTNLKHHYKGVKGGSTYNGFEKKYLMNAISTPSHEFEPEAHVSKSPLDSLKDGIDTLYKFSRPYAVAGMALGIISTSLLTVEKLSDISPSFGIGLLQYIAALFCMHMYHVGVNQLADLEIDKINKPDLPIASGKVSVKIATIVTALFAIMSFGLGWITGSTPLNWAVFASFAIGTAYSVNLPFMRWKRFTLLTMAYIITYPILAFNIAPFLHMKNHVLQRTTIFPRPLIFTIMIMGVFNAVIAISKDLPDMEGDKAQGIRTLAVRIGPERVFWICISLLEMAYGGAIAVGATSPFLWSKIFTVLTHSMMALILWYRAKSVDLKSKANLQAFYMFIFKLTYVEYFLIPFVR